MRHYLKQKKNRKIFKKLIEIISILYHIFQCASYMAAMAEWLRRDIRNVLGSPRAGSNPVRSEYFFPQNIK